jgi:hypothetical protein
MTFNLHHAADKKAMPMPTTYDSAINAVNIACEAPAA